LLTDHPVPASSRVQLRHLLLLFAPAAWIAHYLAPERYILVFLLAVAGIIPLAGWIGHATDQLAERLGSGIGGLLNATFGNATELIIAAFALQEGLFSLVKASITGSIIGNVLLVFGASAFLGGLSRPVQRFNRTAASMGTTMLILSAVGLVVPAVFHRIATRTTPATPELQLDTEIAVVLFVTYCVSLVFTLHTHRQLYGTSTEHPANAPAAPLWKPITVLLTATVGVAFVSEVLVDAVGETARTFGMTETFVGVIIVALVGNAAEHFSAVTLAMDDKMDAAIGIAVGSSTQIALFVAPVLVFLSYVIAPQPMDLLFTTFEIVAVAIAVLTIAFIAHDGETNWMEGFQLLAVYAILALAFYFLPA
jgi:Ca2+:H+ antiporter